MSKVIKEIADRVGSIDKTTRIEVKSSHHSGFLSALVPITVTVTDTSLLSRRRAENPMRAFLLDAAAAIVEEIERMDVAPFVKAARAEKMKIVDPGRIIITDLYARRVALRRELAGVEQAIERCSCNWAYVPPSAFEDRGGDRWIRVSYRTCTKCGVVNERIDENPREGLGTWARTAKFKKEEA